MGVRSRYSDCSLYYVHSYTTCYIISPFLEPVMSQNIGNISYMQISPRERWVGSVCVGLCDANVASCASGKIKQVAPKEEPLGSPLCAWLLEQCLPVVSGQEMLNPLVMSAIALPIPPLFFLFFLSLRVCLSREEKHFRFARVFT